MKTEDIPFNKLINEMRDIINSAEFKHEVYEHTIDNNEAAVRVRKILKILSNLALQARKESMNHSGKYWKYKGEKEPIFKDGVHIVRQTKKSIKMTTFKNYEEHGIKIEFEF